MIITSAPELGGDNLREDDLVVVLPNELAPEGPLTPALRAIIMGIADSGYWPIDFGEGDDTHTTLYFVRGDSPDQCFQQAQFFIRREGEV